MKRNRRLLLRSGLLMAVLGGIAPVIHAATVTTTLPVTATVGAVCTVSATGVNFGAFSGPAVTANGSVSVTCANGTFYSVALNAGDHFGVGGTATRNVVAATGALAYRLFEDPALGNEWGDTCPGGAGSYFGSCFNVIGTGVAEVLTVFGRLEATPSAPPAGTYSDTVLVTVIF
jgi:spore coat protein U-like protein